MRKVGPAPSAELKPLGFIGPRPSKTKTVCRLQRGRSRPTRHKGVPPSYFKLLVRIRAPTIATLVKPLSPDLCHAVL